MSFKDFPIHSSTGLNVSFLANDSMIKFNFTLEISYLSIEDTVFLQIINVFRGMHDYLSEIDSFVRNDISLNETGLDKYEVYFQLLKENKSVEALQSLYKEYPSEAYVIGHYVNYLSLKIAPNRWHEYIYDYGVQEWINRRIVGITQNLDQQLDSIYAQIKDGPSSFDLASIQNLYRLTNITTANFNELISGKHSSIAQPNLGAFSIVDFRYVQIFLNYLTNTNPENPTYHRMVEFLTLDANQDQNSSHNSGIGVPALLSFGEFRERVKERDYVMLSIDACELLSSLFMICSLNSIEDSFGQISSKLKTIHSQNLDTITWENANLKLDNWAISNGNGIQTHVLDISSSNIANDALATITVFYPVENELYLIGESCKGLKIETGQKLLSVNMTIPETTYLLTLKNGYNLSIVPYIYKVSLTCGDTTKVYWKNTTIISNLTRFSTPLDLNTLPTYQTTINISRHLAPISYTSFKFERLAFVFDQKHFYDNREQKITIDAVYPLYYYSDLEGYIDKLEYTRVSSSNISFNLEATVKDIHGNPLFEGYKLSNVPVKYEIWPTVENIGFTVDVKSVIKNQPRTDIEINAIITFESYSIEEVPPIALNGLIVSVVFSLMMLGVALL